MIHITILIVSILASIHYGSLLVGLGIYFGSGLAFFLVIGAMALISSLFDKGEQQG